MIDLHCHILPGLDDGPSTLEESLDMARVASAAGITTIVATPHIREDHPFELAEIGRQLDQLRAALAVESIELDVQAGGEVSLSRIPELSDEELGLVALGDSRYMLVESPYVATTELLEQELFDLQVRGFLPVLAHPERSPSFLADFDRLAQISERGVLCSVTAASMAGRFGRHVQQLARAMFEAGIVDDVASDAHDATRRPPELLSGFAELDSALPGVAAQASWYASDAPRAILDDTGLPVRPQPPRRRRGLERLLTRL